MRDSKFLRAVFSALVLACVYVGAARGQDQTVPRLGLKISFAQEGQLGVLIEQIESGSEAEAKGLRAGGLISQVHHREISTPQDVVAGIARAYQEGFGAVLFKIDGELVAIPFPDRKGQRPPGQQQAARPAPADQLDPVEKDLDQRLRPSNTAQPSTSGVAYDQWLIIFGLLALAYRYRANYLPEKPDWLTTDFSKGVPTWFPLAVLAWGVLLVASVIVRFDRESIVKEQAALGEQIRLEQSRLAEIQRQEQERLREQSPARSAEQSRRDEAQRREEDMKLRCAQGQNGQVVCCPPGQRIAQDIMVDQNQGRVTGTRLVHRCQ